jgi:hypothetical protein
MYQTLKLASEIVSVAVSLAVLTAMWPSGGDAGAAPEAAAAHQATALSPAAPAPPTTHSLPSTPPEAATGLGEPATTLVAGLPGPPEDPAGP